MEVSISADGTETVFVPAGYWSIDIAGTLASGLSVALKTGDADDGSDHVASTDKNGSEIKWEGSGGAGLPEPSVLHGGRFYSFVTTGYSGSSDLKMKIRKAVANG